MTRYKAVGSPPPTRGVVKQCAALLNEDQKIGEEVRTDEAHGVDLRIFLLKVAHSRCKRSRIAIASQKY